MDKKLAFRWVSFVGDSEEYVGGYASSKVMINHLFAKVGLNLLATAAKRTEKLEGVKVHLDTGYESTVLIQGLVEPIELTSSGEVGNYGNKYVTSDNGPSVQWLLDNREALYNADPSKVMYVEGMAIYAAPYYHDNNTLIVTILSTDSRDTFVDMVENEHIEWLNDQTFDIFLESYGYIDEDTNRDIIVILMLYQAAKQLEFKDPIEVVTHFCDRRLIADLKLKGVFEGEFGKCERTVFLIP